tara:strand:+ start:3964 stop:4599 length:636 start_codon:yes stop_codon:yes gene_type:complete
MKDGEDTTKKPFYTDWTQDAIKRYAAYSSIQYLKGIEINKETKVLDIGGFGNRGLSSSLYLLEKGCQIDVINNDDSVREECESYGINFIYGDIFTHSFDKKYDLIISDIWIELHIKMLESGTVDSLLNYLEKEGLLLIYFTDDLDAFNENIEHWKKRKEECRLIVEKFKKNYCNNKSIESVILDKYVAEFLGLDQQKHRKFMKWFKIYDKY